MFAGSQLDMVLGLDIHMEIVPTPAPVPTPFPMPFVGQIELKPLDVLIQAGIGKALSWAFSTPPTGPVLVNNFHGAKTGDEAKNHKTLPHFVIPPGTAWTPLPRPLKLKPKPPPPDPDSPAAPPGDAVFITGSKTVYLEQCNATRLGTLAMSCSDPVRLPSSILLAIPKGLPVLVGGPPAFDWSAAAKAFFLRNKWTAGLLQELVSTMSAGRLRDLASWAACQLTGHPVDVATGRLLTRARHYTLRGPIPLDIECFYSSSRSEHPSPVGFGWSHTLDERIWEERGKVVYKTGDGRELEFSCLDLPGRRMREGAEVFFAPDRLWLRLREGGVYEVRSVDGRVREFTRLPGDARTWFLGRLRDREEHWVAFRYDAHARLEAVETSEGRWLRLEHDVRGLLTRIAVPVPEADTGWYNQVSFEYSEQGDLVRATDSQGHARAYRYESHLMIQETDRDGVTFWFEYDGRDGAASCVRTWGDDGQGGDRLYFREITYDKRAMVTLVEDSFGKTTTYRMNVANAVVEILDPHGASTKIEYDEHLWKTAETDPLGHVTRREYDARGNETKRVLPNGGTFTIEYDGWDRAVRMVDPLGAEWTWGYVDFTRPLEAQARLLGRSTPSAQMRFSYEGKQRTRVEIHDRVFVIDQDGFGQVARITYPDQTYEERWYDRQGRLVKTRDSGGRVRRLAYDWESRVVQVSEPGGVVRQVQYSAEGDVLRYGDPIRRVEYAYTGYHKVAWREEGGERVEYRYTSEDDLIGVVNELGEMYSFSRDACRRIVEEVGFDGRTHRFVRDAAGRVETLFKPSKATQKIAYDALGRVTSVAYGDGTEEAFTYDLLGGLKSATNASGTVRFERDAARRVVREQFGEHWVASKFDGPGGRVGVTTSLGLDERIRRGPMGDVRAVGVWERNERGEAQPTWGVGFERDDLGNEVKRILPGGVTASWAREESGLPRALTVSREGELLAQTEYLWEGDSRLRGIRRWGEGDTWFSHDARNRLVAARAPDGEVQWRAPGPTGNLYKTAERTDRRYGRGGVLLEAEGVKYTYDADGNLSARAFPNGAQWKYVWNADGTLRKVTLPSGGDVTFSYDALRRRLAKNTSERTMTWIWDGNVALHEIAAVDGRPTEAATWLVEPGQFAPLGRIGSSGSKTSVLTDYLGSPTEMVDDVGRVTWKGQLDIYGHPRLVTGSAGDCPWRAPGQYADEETGLYYNRFRYYMPETGRFVSLDPIRLGGGSDLYGHLAVPLIAIDPLGLADIYQVGTYGSLNGGTNVGDVLQAHEMIRNAWLKALGLAPNGRLSDNPAIALPDPVHAAVHAEEASIRASRGLGPNEFADSLTEELNITELAMLRAGVPRDKVEKLRTDAEAYGERKACPQ